MTDIVQKLWGFCHTLPMSLPDMHEMRNSKNRGMYRLAMFSRHRLGINFCEACRESTNPQASLF